LAERAASLLSGKVVAITGAGSGIGRSCALEAARSGAAVVVNDIDDVALDELIDQVRSAGGQATVSPGSIAELETSKRIIDCCLTQYGQIDGIVSCAGIFPVGVPWEQDEADIRRAVEVNLLGSIFFGASAIKAMARAGKGAVIYVTSASQMGHPDMSVYGATKGGIAALTYCQSKDLADSNIRVNAVSPTAKTKMSDAYSIRRIGQPLPEDAPGPETNAPLFIFLLSDLSEGITGRVISVNDTRLTLVAPPAFTDRSFAVSSGTSAEDLARGLSSVLAEVE
jgi:NAD(P)-dependent dehydrogenase (short-subunit alcohol dehydrogenase family)